MYINTAEIDPTRVHIKLTCSLFSIPFLSKSAPERLSERFPKIPAKVLTIRR